MADYYVKIPSSSSTQVNWLSPSVNAAALPLVGNSDGDARVTLNDDSIYVWHSGTSSWLLTATPAATVAITALNTDVVANGPGAVVATIQPNVVTNAKLNTAPTMTLKGNNTGGSANVSDLTTAQVQTMLGYVTALTGDVTATGPGSVAAAVTFVGTSSAANVHSAELLANASTNLNTASTIVKRDASGNFTAGNITAALTGNADTATNSTNSVVTSKSDSVDYFLTFVGSNASSNQGIDVGPAKYNPSTSTITATVFSGALTGHASLDLALTGGTMSGSILLAAGTAAAGTSPVKFQSGTNLSAVEAGAMEYDGTSLLFSPDGTRYNVLLNNYGLSGGQTVVGGTAASNALTLSSTSNATKGNILFGTSAYDEVNNRLGVGTTSPTAALHLKAGTAAASTAPLKLTSGTNLTTAEAGAMEYNGSSLLFTPTTTAGRSGVVMYDAQGNVYSQLAKGATAFSASNTGNVLLGNGAGAAMTGSYPTNAIAIGYQALNRMIGSSNPIGNIGIGTEAGAYITNGSQNILIGTYAGTRAGFGEGLATGGQNIGIGYEVLTRTSGSYNISAGYNALRFVTSGNGNIGIGYLVGDALTTGSKNVAIGYDIDTQSASADGQLTIQNAIFGTGNTGTGTTASTGNIGIYTVAPSARLHLPAGSATASTAPLKLTSGTLNTTPEAGSVEYLTNLYYGTTTTGAKRGAFSLNQTGRATAQTAANASIATFTLPATDGSFQIAANVLVTTSSAEAFTVTCDYTDSGNTARTVTLNFSTLAGTIGTSVAFANGAVPYSGIPITIRCKASTSITIKTDAGGTYTGCTYDVEGFITQTS